MPPERWPAAPVDTDPPQAEPVEQRLADELSTKRADVSAEFARALAVLRRLGRYDHTAYRSVARLSTPLLDKPLRRVSGFANFSKPWSITAGFLAIFGGPHGRRVALTGLAAVGATSLVVNQPMKLIGERRRPNRRALEVPQQRWVTMPSSTSFPSGHSASAAAFAVAVGDLLPTLNLPLRGAASIVAFPASTPACTTRTTFSSARPWAPSSAGWPRQWRAVPEVPRPGCRSLSHRCRQRMSSQPRRRPKQARPDLLRRLSGRDSHATREPGLTSRQQLLITTAVIMLRLRT